MCFIVSVISFHAYRTNLGWVGGASPGPEMGTSVGWGIYKIFAGWGDPIPQGKTLSGVEKRAFFLLGRMQNMCTGNKNIKQKVKT